MGVALSCLLRVEFDYYIFIVNFNTDMGNCIARSVLKVDTTWTEFSLT